MSKPKSPKHPSTKHQAPENIQAPSAKAPEVKVVTDLSQIEALMKEPITCDVLIRGTPFRFTGRRLVPAETKEVKLLMQRALPPLTPGAPGEEGKYNLDDPEYQRRAEDFKRQARAFALWRAYPYFRERWLAPPENIQIPNLKLQSGAEPTGAEVMAFIENLALDDDSLDALFRAVTSDIGQVQRYATFI